MYVPSPRRVNRHAAAGNLVDLGASAETQTAIMGTGRIRQMPIRLQPPPVPRGIELEVDFWTVAGRAGLKGPGGAAPRWNVSPGAGSRNSAWRSGRNAGQEPLAPGAP